MHGLRTAHELPYRDQQQPTENSIGRKEKHHGPSLQQDDEPNAGYAYRLHGGRQDIKFYNKLIYSILQRT